MSVPLYIELTILDSPHLKNKLWALPEKNCEGGGHILEPFFNPLPLLQIIIGLTLSSN